MEPLYKTQTAYSFEEYSKYNEAVLLKQKGFKAVMITLPVLYVLLMGAVFYSTREISTVFVVLFALLLSTAIFIASFKKTIKKTYYSNKAITSCVADFEFYDNYVREITQNGETKLEYSKIYKIIETKTNFYIMASVNQGFIIVKSNCPDGLIDFIKSIKAETESQK